MSEDPRRWATLAQTALACVLIWLTPQVAARFDGWQHAFWLMAPGPIVGALAMARLRTLPDARRLAGGGLFIAPIPAAT